LPHGVEIVFPTNSGRRSNSGLLPVQANKISQGFFDGRFFGGQTGGGHGLGEQYVIKLDVGSHDEPRV